jgi:hypothetical protein
MSPETLKKLRKLQKITEKLLHRLPELPGQPKLANSPTLFFLYFPKTQETYL